MVQVFRSYPGIVQLFMINQYLYLTWDVQPLPKDSNVTSIDIKQTASLFLSMPQTCTLNFQQKQLTRQWLAKNLQLKTELIFPFPF